LSIGLVVPIEHYAHGPRPQLTRHVERVQLAESLGFSAVWLRDVPFDVPSFGDAGQILDPFVYLGLLGGATERIALGVASIILPLRHPAHVAKAAASVDVLSNGRLLLGVASGDRPDEYPAMALPFAERGERFRTSFDYIRQVAADTPTFDNAHGSVSWGIDMAPKPTGGRLPMLSTGSSQQHPDWIANNGDGWMMYPRDHRSQHASINQYRQKIAAASLPDKPVMQPLYIDLVDDGAVGAPQPIHLGLLRLRTRDLRAYLDSAQDIGVNHVALNLRFNAGDVESTLRWIADELLPAHTSNDVPDYSQSDSERS
jgi:luciferase-type oxidoreductase